MQNNIMRKFQYKVIYFCSFLKQTTKAQIQETINTAYMRKKELGELNTILFEQRDRADFQEIQQMIKEALPPIQSVSKLTDLKNYSRIAYKLDLKKDQQIVQQLFTIILQDQLGNFILKDKLIHHIIDSVKIKSLDSKTQELISQLNLKDSILQKQYISKFVNAIQLKLNPNNEFQAVKQSNNSNSNRLQVLAQIVNNKQIRQNLQILDEQYSNPSLQEILILLPQIQYVSQNLKNACIQKLKEYLESIQVEQKQEGKVLTELNQLIYKNPEFFKKNQLPFTQVLEQLNINSLLESQVNQILYIVMNSQNVDYFKQHEQEIIEYILNKKSINMQQMVSYFVHLSQIYRTLDNFPSEVLDYICQFAISNISKCDSNQIFLLIKSLRLCQQTDASESLNKLIENKVEKGALNSNPDALLNVVANKIKKSQVLFMPEIANQIEITQRNFGEWCHLIYQISQLRDLDQEVIEKFKKCHHLYRDRIGQNQFFYYFVAQFACEIDDSEYLIQKIQQIRPFQLIRVLYHINQNAYNKYSKLTSSIINIIKNNDKYLWSEFNILDRGLLSFSLLSASLMDDQSFYNYLMKKYKNEIDKLVNELVESDKKFSREKIIGVSTVKQISNQTLIQFYSSLRYHQCLSGEDSIYYKKLQDIMMHYKDTKQEMPSYKEETVESYLKQWKIQYFKDYNEILPFRIDFYIPHKNLGIECNGVSHYCFGQLKRTDVLKYKFLESQQIKIEVIQSHSINIEQRLSELNIKQ